MVLRSHRLVTAALAFASAVACSSAPIDKPLKLDKVDKGPGTLSEARQYLEGRWTLVSMDLFPPDFPAVHNAATGSMTYDNFSNMKVEMQLNPEATQLADRIGIPNQTGQVLTTGRTVIDIGNHAISYVLEGQPGTRPPTHPLDTNLPRYWEVSGDTLTLRTKDEAGKILSVSVWRKE